MLITYSGDALPHVANWTEWLDRFKGRPVHGLEVGCFEGHSTQWFIDEILTHPESTMTVVDNFEGEEWHKANGIDMKIVRSNFYANMIPHGKRVRVYEGASQEKLVEMRQDPRRFNFIYVDANHTACDVLSDLVLCWPLLMVGGMLIADDYEWHFCGPLTEPKMAIDAFLACYEGRYRLTYKGYQVCLEKFS